MDASTVLAALESATREDSRELDRTCERVAGQLIEAGQEPPFAVASADFETDPRLICADRYWRLRFLELPTVTTAAACAQWLAGRVAADHRAEVREKWALGYAFITKDSVESRRDLAEATEAFVRDGDDTVDTAFFATLYHAGKLRSNFSFDELHQFLDSSVLAVAAHPRRDAAVLLALRAFAGLGSRIVATDHAVELLEAAWASPERTRHVIDICLNGLSVAAPFDGPEGELLRDKAREAVALYPGDNMFHFRLARGHRLCKDHEAAWASIHEALRLLPAIGTRTSHKLLQEQYIQEREYIQNARIQAAEEAAKQAEEERRRTEDEAERHSQREANREMRSAMASAGTRANQQVAIFAAAVTFALGALEITLNGDMTVGERVLLMTVLGVSLAVFSLIIVGASWYITRFRADVPYRRRDG